MQRGSEDFRAFEQQLEQRGAKLVFWKTRDTGQPGEVLDMRVLLPGKERRAVRTEIAGRTEAEVYAATMKGLFPND